MADNTRDIDEDATNLVLYELGLSEYETRAYLTILEGGVIVAREISDRSSIPYAKVYQVLENLVLKQFIIGDEGRPRKFRCVDPKIGLFDRLESIKTNWEQKQQRRRSLIEKVLPEFSLMFKATKNDIADEQGVWTINGLANIGSRISTLMSKTKSHIRVSAGDVHFLQSRVSKILFDCDPGIEVTIRVSENNDLLKNYGRIVTIPSIGKATIIIFDDFAQLSIVESKRGKYAAGEYTAVLTQISPLVESAIIDFTTSIRTEV
ncbi:MAG: TrmB family transcriptional regulator [Candidatus Kariarchaeaceae archaeon]|jgi:sugar-specific transcriptional regulator TrmB